MRLVAACESMLPGVWEVLARGMDRLLAGRWFGDRLIKHPPYAYAQTHGLVYEFMVQCRQPDEETLEQVAFYMVEISALASWRTTKTIYRLDPDLMRELLATPVSGALPVEALMRLPVWCPYIELDFPITWGCSEEQNQGRIIGCFAYLDYLDEFDETGAPTTPSLRLGFDTGADELGYVLPINIALLPGRTIEECLARVDEVHQPARLANRTDDRAYSEAMLEGMLNGDIPPEFLVMVRRTLSVLLYLCADNAEVDKRAVPNPLRILRGRSGPTLPIAPAVQLIRCGVHIGRRLREARERVQRDTPTGQTVAPHVRAAHWHHFWKGPRDGERELVLRWLSPILVNVDGDAPEATTLREVRG